MGVASPESAGHVCPYHLTSDTREVIGGASAGSMARQEPYPSPAPLVLCGLLEASEHLRAVSFPFFVLGDTHVQARVPRLCRYSL